MASVAGSQSASGSSGDDARAPLVSRVGTIVTKPADSCQWYAGETCGRPRSCFDCLNSPLVNGSECTISPFGECVALSEYAWADDFRLHDVTNLFNYYPSINTTYCSQTEPGCSDCRLRLVKEKQGLYGYLYSRTMKAQCLGADGCVCVAACESETWRANVLKLESCPVSAEVDDTEDKSKRVIMFRPSQSAYVLLVISIIGLLVLLVLTRRWWVGHNKAVQRRARFANMKLKLDGWYSYRQKLIDDENAQLESAPKLKLYHDNHDHADESRRSSLNLSTDVEPTGDPTTEPTAQLVVERGDGYRPLSPSEYDHQRHRRTREDAEADAA